MTLLEDIKQQNTSTINYIDLFCGMGGFRVAFEKVSKEFNLKANCVLSCDIDPDARRIYHSNFGEEPQRDIKTIDLKNIPKHEILFAGFPCQPFSICGDMKGFDDLRGTLFFEIVKILAEKKPDLFLLENVKQLKGHDRGRTLQRIIDILTDLGYYIQYQILNALDFGLPQKRERIFIVGFREPVNCCCDNAKGTLCACKFPMTPLGEILEPEVEPNYYASETIRKNRLSKYQAKSKNSFDKNQQYPTIWHENKAGHISAYPYSCALRAGASYNYLLVNGERRLTEREMLRLQGFPDSFKIVGSYSTMRKLVGNSVAIPCVESIISAMLQAVLQERDYSSTPISAPLQLSLF